MRFGLSEETCGEGRGQDDWNRLATHGFDGTSGSARQRCGIQRGVHCAWRGNEAGGYERNDMADGLGAVVITCEGKAGRYAMVTRGGANLHARSGKVQTVQQGDAAADIKYTNTPRSEKVTQLFTRTWTLVK
ncbi:hypothetical protein TRVL_06496 [Trypanosoma vivax]|nr:hypothetical protein TRVL_06496 [Trypanosoma vivax]